MKKTLLAAVTLFVGSLVLGGCSAAPEGSLQESNVVKESPSKLFVRKATKEEIGKEVSCPVMTMEKFKVSTVTPVIDYKGKTYFMCCNGCPEKFMANPEKYIK